MAYSAPGMSACLAVASLVDNYGVNFWIKESLVGFSFLRQVLYPEK